jgi:hypothetical protein
MHSNLHKKFYSCKKWVLHDGPTWIGSALRGSPRECAPIGQGVGSEVSLERAGTGGLQAERQPMMVHRRSRDMAVRGGFWQAPAH